MKDYRGRMDLKVRLLEEKNKKGGWFGKTHPRLQGAHSADCKMNKIPSKHSAEAKCLLNLVMHVIPSNNRPVWRSSGL